MIHAFPLRRLAAAALLWLVAPVAAAHPSPGTADGLQSASRAADADYRVAAGDKLRIEVYQESQLSQSVQVRPDGKITLPLVGDIDAIGRTPLELRSDIANRLMEFLTEPVVTVIVVEATPATAYVVGEVNRPGAVILDTDGLTVLQALALAGGLKDFADQKNIRILRKSFAGVQAIGFNYKDAIRGAPAIYLQAGDTVVVPD
jgi:polysaccharide export outer membrane protein